MSIDTLRLLAFVMAGMSYGLALANLIISFKVLKVRKTNFCSFAGSGGGFIWSHILCVAIAFEGLVTLTLIDVVQHTDMAFIYRAYAIFGLCLLMNIGYVIIFRVEMARVRLQKIMSEAE